MGPREKNSVLKIKKFKIFIYLVTEAIKQLRLRWVKHVEWIGEMRDARNILLGNMEEHLGDIKAYAQRIL